jgi:hypothetical protein
MRARLAAAAAGTLLIAVVIAAIALSSHPVVAGTTRVEPARPSGFLSAGTRQCQVLSRLPADADRMKIVVSSVTGGAHRLDVEISDQRGLLAAGDLEPARTGERLIKLHPRTRAAHRARLCFSNPGPGQITFGGDVKRFPGTPKGKKVEKGLIASAIFLRPGSASWLAQAGTIAERYANSQTGITGAWSFWAAVVFAIGAALLGLGSVLGLPRRSQ